MFENREKEMASLLGRLYYIISFAVWLVALFGFDVLAKDLNKKKKIIATICLALAFVVWIEGSNVHDKTVREDASRKVIVNLQEDNLLPDGDYSAYYDLYPDIDFDE